MVHIKLSLPLSSSLTLQIPKEPILHQVSLNLIKQSPWQLTRTRRKKKGQERTFFYYWGVRSTEREGDPPAMLRAQGFVLYSSLRPLLPPTFLLCPPQRLPLPQIIYIVELNPWVNLSHCSKRTPSSVVSAKIFGRLSNNNVDSSTSISGCSSRILSINSIVR